jgi:catechol 2,3-dioxygenase-like lactoylglutathione lyase family enzyme
MASISPIGPSRKFAASRSRVTYPAGTVIVSRGAHTFEHEYSMSCTREKPMTFTQGIAEIVLVVEDVRRSARFYQDVVRLAVEKDGGDAYAWFWTGQPERSQRLGLLKEPLAFEQYSPRPEGERWGPVHYAFRVPRDELDAAAAHVQGCGVDIHGPEHIRWMHAQVYYFFDPDGNLLELWSPDPSLGSHFEVRVEF